MSHPRRNVITRALGIEAAVDVDAWVIDTKPGDRFLLCSDGLFNEMTDDEMAAILRRDVPPPEAAWELVRLANESGGRDNISAVVVDVLGDTDTDDADTIADRLVRVTEPADEVIIRTDSMEYSATPTPVFAEAPPAVAPSTVETPERPGTSRSRWRVWTFALAIVAILAVGTVATVTVARSGFYLTDNGTEVQLFQGRREGLLWFHPTLVESTGVKVADLRESDRLAIDQQTFTSRAGATAFIDELRGFALSNTFPTTTSAPTTSEPMPADSTTTTIIAGP